jgi:integrase
MRDIINSALAAGGLETVEAVTSQAWIETWKKSKAGSVTLRTKWKFDQRANEWLRFLGPKADKTLEMVTKDDAVAYRDHLAHQGLSAQTANHAVKLLRGIHEEALRQGHISRNPFAGVGRLKEDTEGTRREPFTQREVAKLIEAADGDWRGLIILAGTSALRLMDAARLKWSSIDLETGWIRIKTSKTGAKLMLPIHDDLAAWLKTQPRGIGQAPLFPALAEKGGAGKSGLSMCFRRLMNRAGVSAGVAREGEGRGRTTARKSFHSLRHFAASQMAQGGVRNEIARSITGHSDTASHEGYITADADALRSAVNTIRLSA